MMESRPYDLLLCGVTGFTGKLAAEYLLYSHFTHIDRPKDLIRFAVCGRNRAKIGESLQEAYGFACRKANELNKAQPPAIDSVPVEVVDLVCGDSDEKYQELKAVVSKAEVVITTAGPFWEYGQDLVRACIECNTHYADITGETDFVRKLIGLYDRKAHSPDGPKTTIVPHCGHDCVPWDICVWHLAEYSKKELRTELQEVVCYAHLAGEVSGGTTATIKNAIFHRKKITDLNFDFDPLQLERRDDANPYQSPLRTKVAKFCGEALPAEYANAFGANKIVNDWVMAGVNANCVRRSNVLCGYGGTSSDEDANPFFYKDGRLAEGGVSNSVGGAMWTAKFGLGLALDHVGLPSFGLIPQPGEGPSRETMEKGYLKLIVEGRCANNEKVVAEFTTKHDAGYMDTAKMLVAAGILLVRQSLEEGGKGVKGGVVTPAFAFGRDMTEFLKEHAGLKFKIEKAK